MSKTVNPGRNIGFAQAPEKTCEDPACPFHGVLSVRGKIVEGVVVNDANAATVTISREMLVLDRKYKRYYRKYSKISAHRTPCLDVKIGDKIRVGETRKIAKHVYFVVIENLGSSLS